MHVAIIPDGNRRWAKIHNLPIEKGHEKGISKLEDLIKWAREFNVNYLSIWILSTENTSRKKEEIKTLFKLFRKAIKKLEEKRKEKNEEDIRVRFIGDLSFFPKDIRKKMKEIERKTKNGKFQVLFLANYGGRREIVDAVKKILKEREKMKKIKINEENFRKYLYAPDVPDPDLIIRTAEKRLSNFCVWQCAYSEIYFVDKLWPDFTREDFEKALKDFEKRERRFGR